MQLSGPNSLRPARSRIAAALSLSFFLPLLARQQPLYNVFISAPPKESDCLWRARSPSLNPPTKAPLSLRLTR